MKKIALAMIIPYFPFFMIHSNQPWIEYVFFIMVLVLFTIEPMIFKSNAEIINILKIFSITIFAALMILSHIKYFVVQPFRVKEQSMLPKLQSNDLILVEKISMGLIINFYEKNDTVKRLHLPFARNLAQKDIIVFRRPDTGEILIKRIHSIENNKYCVFGDNINHSIDSRTFGCLDEDRIIGRFVYKISG